MNSELQEAVDLDDAYIMHTYGRLPVAFERGEGTRLYDGEGNEYLDFLAGIASCPLGHADPAVSAAIAGQASRLVQSSNYFYDRTRGLVAREIADIAGPGLGWKTFFANSGAEANECAMKAARRWGVDHGGVGRQTVVVLKGSFHGRTMETLAATAQGWLQDPFQPLPGGFRAVARNDEAGLDAAMGPDVCAIMMEPIQGESGVWPLSDPYLAHVRKVADEWGCLVIFDEVQTGLYRCGKPLCFQTAAGEDGGPLAVPDIFTLAKGIANGVPCAACVARGEAAESLKPGMHGSTFGGNPLAMAAAYATLTRLRELKAGEHAAEMGTYLRERLAELPYVTEVRGKGLMVGATVEGRDAHDVVKALLDRRIVSNACNDAVLRFLPALVVGKDDVDRLVGELAML